MIHNSEWIEAKFSEADLAFLGANNAPSSKTLAATLSQLGVSDLALSRAGVLVKFNHRLFTLAEVVLISSLHADELSISDGWLLLWWD